MKKLVSALVALAFVAVAPAFAEEKAAAADKKADAKVEKVEKNADAKVEKKDEKKADEKK